jgi:hypothetical protein
MYNFDIFVILWTENQLIGRFLSIFLGFGSNKVITRFSFRNLIHRENII